MAIQGHDNLDHRLMRAHTGKRLLRRNCFCVGPANHRSVSLSQLAEVGVIGPVHACCYPATTEDLAAFYMKLSCGSSNRPLRDESPFFKLHFDRGSATVSLDQLWSRGKPALGRNSLPSHFVNQVQPACPTEWRGIVNWTPQLPINL